jgi:hypothetical protein
MRKILKDDGVLFVTFGYTWYHPLGGHLFSVFPWAHLILTEKTLIRWRSDFKTDGATRFREMAGGLNRMSIRRWEEILADIHPRIIKGTSRSAKRKPIGSDRLRMVLHLSEDPGQGADQFRDGREVPVVSSGLAGVLPEALRGIELR